jgi:hypothetical protein
VTPRAQPYGRLFGIFSRPCHENAHDLLCEPTRSARPQFESQFASGIFGFTHGIRSERSIEFCRNEVASIGRKHFTPK